MNIVGLKPKAFLWVRVYRAATDTWEKKYRVDLSPTMVQRMLKYARLG